MSQLQSRFELNNSPQEVIDSPFVEDLNIYDIDVSMKSKLKRFYEERMQPNLGIIFALISQFFNSCMALSCKLLLMEKDNVMDPMNILVIRMSITYLLCYGYMWFTKVPEAPFGPKKLRTLLLLRGVTGFIGVSTQYYGLLFLSISDETVITFLGPTVTALLASYFLRERYTKSQAICGFISLCGVILVARPSFIFGNLQFGKSDPNDGAETHDPRLRLLGSFIALLCCLSSSASMILVRKIGFEAHPLISVSFFSLMTLVVATIVIAINPRLSFNSFPVNFKQWFLIINMGASGFIMQFLITAGMQREKAGRTVSMSYTQLVYTTFYDFFFYNHLPNYLSIIGSGIIISAACYTIYNKEEEDDTRPLGYTDLENALSPSSRISMSPGVEEYEFTDGVSHHIIGNDTTYTEDVDFAKFENLSDEENTSDGNTNVDSVSMNLLSSQSDSESGI